MLQKDC